MLKIENLTKSYSKSKSKAVDNISFDIKRSEIFGFIGPNGAGKTTTIKMMVGLLNPDSGKIVINGHDLKTEMIEAKKSFGYVADNHELFENLTALEYLNFIANVYNVSENDRKSRIEKYAKLLELEGAIGGYIKSFSHGMKQKVSLIAALIHEPPLWILDEPLTGLDPRSIHNIKILMKEHCDKGNSVFFSTHILEVAENLCDRIAVIKNGKIIAMGTLEELKNGSHKSLENVFLEMVE